MERKQHIIRSLDLAEVSAVDSPAQEGAGALLRKNHMNNDNLSNILADAERVSKGAPPRYTRDQAETAMLELARTEAHEGEGVCNAFARLCGSDERMQKLYGLAEAADVTQNEQAEQLAKRATRNERVWELMVKGAHSNRREGETVEQALDRMLRTDKTYQDAYALYCE
jgi:hypothetical protein